MSGRSAIGIVLKLVGIALALYLVADAWFDRAVENDKTPRLEKELDEKQRKLASRDDYAKQLKELRTLLAPLQRRLPGQLDQTALEKTLHEQAATAGVEITGTQWNKETNQQGFYVEKPANIDVRASPTQFAAFMNAFLRDAPYRQVDAMTLERADDDKTLRAQMIVVYFRYPENPQ